jgi:hypothetical protein
VLAAGPAKIGVLIPANPTPGEPGHYTVSFPLRPGETKFAFNYDLPYEGHAVFETKLTYPVQQLAVMIPQSMKFSSHSSAFALLPTGRSDYQVQTANQLKAGEGPGFEVSGTGVLPPLGDQAQSQAGTLPLTTPRQTAPNADRALSSFGRVDPQLQQTYSRSQSPVLGGLTAVLLGVCALLVWRARKTPGKTGASNGRKGGQGR